MKIIKNHEKELPQCRIITDFHSQIIIILISAITGSGDYLLMEKYCIVRILTPIVERNTAIEIIS